MPELRTEDTIAAIATPAGEGGLAVIRVSGEKTFETVAAIFQPKKGVFKNFLPQTVHFGTVCDASGNLLDQVLVTLFRSPHSYTGQDLIEISSHGGIVVSRKILGLLLANGARAAEPGEFTRRAFLNGKIDLTQAEAVLDLIKARSEKSLEVAARQLAGALSLELAGLKEELMKMYAHLEAFLDFPEEDLEIFEDEEFPKRFKKIQARMEMLIQSFRRGVVLREGIKAVIAGKPNVGKSSLFNTLLARDRAIVSEFPGTTRDTLEEAIEIGGVYIRLTDTAGLADDFDHPVDKISMERTRQALCDADFYLFMLDRSMPLEASDRAAFKALNPEKPVFLLTNKCDLPEKLSQAVLRELNLKAPVIALSMKTREGIEALEKQIAAFISKEGLNAEGEQLTRLRHLRAVEESLAALARAEESFRAKRSLEFVVVDLKAAIDSLRELIGEVYSEDLLDVIFSEFCIGK